MERRPQSNVGSFAIDFSSTPKCESLFSAFLLPMRGSILLLRPSSFLLNCSGIPEYVLANLEIISAFSPSILKTRVDFLKQKINFEVLRPIHNYICYYHKTCDVLTVLESITSSTWLPSSGVNGTDHHDSEHFLHLASGQSDECQILPVDTMTLLYTNLKLVILSCDLDHEF
jgi:hypothetical protein